MATCQLAGLESTASGNSTSESSTRSRMYTQTTPSSF
ncbi:hypothetical protein LINPERPRIM_LOCUS34386 [Linum perenne]